VTVEKHPKLVLANAPRSWWTATRRPGPRSHHWPAV